MALALNVFQTVTFVAPTSPVGIYTAPVGYTGVVLLAQAANVGSVTKKVSLSHVRTTAGIAVTTEIIKDLAEYKISNPNSKIKGVHIFPLGGIEKASSFIESLRTG